MTQVFTNLLNDEAGFIVSSELILISTIVVLSLIVGLSEVANAVNQEFEDVATAFGAVNQSYRFSGYQGHKGRTVGSINHDDADFCDNECDIVCNNPPRSEGSFVH